MTGIREAENREDDSSYCFVFTFKDEEKKFRLTKCWEKASTIGGWSEVSLKGDTKHGRTGRGSG